MNKFSLLLWVTIFLSCTPFVAVSNLAEYDEKRWLMMCCCSLMVLLTRVQHLSEQLRNLTWLKFPLLLISAGFLLTISAADHPAQLLLHGLNWLMLFLFAIAFASHQHTTSTVSFYPALFLSLLLLHLMIMLMISFEILNQQEIDPWLIVVEFENQRFFNQLQILTLPALIFYQLHPRYGRVIKFTIWMSLLQLLLTGGRGASLTIFLLMFSLWLLPQFRPIVVATLKPACSALLCYALIMIRPVQTDLYLFRTGSSNRVEMWQELLVNLDWQHLFFGYGGGNYPLHTQLTPLAHPHNFVLQFIAEWGLLSCIGLLMLFLGVLYKAKNHADFYLKKQLHIPFFTLSAALCYGLFDGVFVMPVSQLLLFVWLGCLLSQMRTETLISSDKPQAINLLLELAKTILVVCFLVLAWTNFQFHLHTSAGFFGPNFWFSGDPW
jgi:hypothetical protein